MQSLQIKALIAVGSTSFISSAAASIYLLLSPMEDLSTRPLGADHRGSLGETEMRDSPHLGFQGLRAAQNAPLFLLHRVPFVPQVQVVATPPTPVLPAAAVVPPPPEQAQLSAPAPSAPNGPVYQVVAPQFVLKGILIRHSGKQVLLISSEKPQGQWYAIGDSVSGWTVDVIDPDKITIKNEGHTTDLFLYVDNRNKPVGTP